MRRSAGSAQILVVDVGEHLIVRVRMNRRHQTVLDANFVLQGLDERRQAVGRAGGVGNHKIRGLKHILIHAVDHRRVRGLARGRKQHFLRTGFDMHHRGFFRIEGSRALHHQIDAEVSPGQFTGITRLEDVNAIPADDHIFAVRFNRRSEAAVHRVVLQEMGVHCKVARRIDGDDFNVVLLGILVMSAEHVAADAAEPIDGNTDGHVGNFLDIEERDG